ncbi:hypothetical protein NDU88_000748 [Pleurodeles waltl]|uniref:Uncharacterized protein n=1 Tax=Pleurodeles waltl TaxID=8319 RepID=A0AAV7UUY6_PLEWA|nr:hypothetical protein NDU88_000748 [Pleurodeles waltl]
MAGYDDQAEDLYYIDDTAGSFDQDLVYALNAGVRHSVNQALVQAIQPIKHHLLGLVDQQAWTAPVGAPSLEDPSFAAGQQSAKQPPNPHAADLQSLLRNMAREHDYNAGSQKKAVDDPASSSSDHSSEQEDAPPRKRKKKAPHQEEMMRSNGSTAISFFFQSSGMPVRLLSRFRLQKDEWLGVIQHFTGFLLYG